LNGKKRTKKQKASGLHSVGNRAGFSPRDIFSIASHPESVKIRVIRETHADRRIKLTDLQDV